jgi:hypothetical protein
MYPLATDRGNATPALDGARLRLLKARQTFAQAV